jgi:hypothetical protein
VEKTAIATSCVSTPYPQYVQLTLNCVSLCAAAGVSLLPVEMRHSQPRSGVKRANLNFLEAGITAASATDFI